MKKLPTVTFDTSRLTAKVLADFERCVRKLPEITPENFEEFYDLALRSIATGGDLSMFSKGISAMALPGMTTQRAAEISTRLWLRVSGRSEFERQAQIGITHCIWMYSNAPCMANPKRPSTSDLQLDAAHKEANGKSFEIGEGLVLNGRRVWPGDEDGCRCWSRPVIKGLEGFDDAPDADQPTTVELMAALQNATQFKGKARAAEMVASLRRLFEAKRSWKTREERALRNAIQDHLNGLES